MQGSLLTQLWSSREKKSYSTLKNASVRSRNSSWSSSSSRSPSLSSNRGISRWQTLYWTTWREGWISIGRWRCQTRNSSCPCYSWSVSQIAELRFLKTTQKCTSSCPLTGNSQSLMRTFFSITWGSPGPPPKNWAVCLTQKSSIFWRALS